ncbi:MAG: hypothetical protein SNF33_06825 [Candidatus Algichlamydia australiensis]|nr:hypothetical protein [Chlamydiales bacterium]
MKKIICFLAIVLVVGFAAFLGHFYFHRAEILANYLSEKLGVHTTIKSIDLHWDSFTINQLVVHNPKGYKMDKAMEVGKITFDAPLINYFKKDIDIQRIAFENIWAGIEFNDKDNSQGNWTQIVQNVDSNFSTTNPIEEVVDKTSFRYNRTVLIELLGLYNVNVDILLSGERNPRKLNPIPKMEFQNVGTEKGLPIEEITEVIIKKLLEQITLMEGVTNMVIGISGQATNILLSPFKVFFGGQ